MVDVINLSAAGSLKSVMNDIIKDFRKASGFEVTARFGAAGGLRERIESGEPCCVFASANMEHPERLQVMGLAENVVRFAGNAMCAVLRPGLKSDSNALEMLMKSPAIRIGTSTPVNDPCGDYALHILSKVGISLTSEKMVIVTGGKSEKIVRQDGRSDYAAALAAQTDMVLIYRTAADRLTEEIRGATIIDLPPQLAHTANCGIAAIRPATALAKDFIAFVMSDAGQTRLVQHGFVPALAG